MNVKKLIAGAAVAGGLIAGPLAVAGTASAEPHPMPPAPPAGPSVGTAPAWAPPKPVDPAWAQGNPQVWDSGWNHWGVWINGVFVPTY
ncbi:hypothetical protein SAMN04488581_2797 [Mycolicibacterium neoaurum]|uniref:hypothetical protein n=1 Tax=Mycolicibacterium neoaurum TaxID=1795 RepID=UPI00055A2EED|nr:hypothetical protein [Mycolicibacterium neoaurum]SDD67587.1 hypothetical protein SAMN04488581_2797 [Mycolicibacterium neoaurum]